VCLHQMRRLTLHRQAGQRHNAGGKVKWHTVLFGQHIRRHTHQKKECKVGLISRILIPFRKA
jgi:hypothetical protein